MHVSDMSRRGREGERERGRGREGGDRETGEETDRQRDPEGDGWMGSEQLQKLFRRVLRTSPSDPGEKVSERIIGRRACSNVCEQWLYFWLSEEIARMHPLKPTVSMEDGSSSQTSNDFPPTQEEDGESIVGLPWSLPNGPTEEAA
eukprot:752843-Hanusia_phi.AAC.6